MRCRHVATTWAHHDAVLVQVQLHDVIRFLSNVMATLHVVNSPDIDSGVTTIALKWKPKIRLSVLNLNQE